MKQKIFEAIRSLQRKGLINVDGAQITLKQSML